MAKKGGKKGKTKNKGGGGGGGGGGAAGKKVADAKNNVSAGHQVEDRTMYTEGEPETSTTQAGDAVAAATAVATETLVPASAPDVASKTPSAAPPKVTEDEESKEEKEKPQEEEETKEAEDTLLSKVATKDSIQGAVDKVQASKAGHVSNLDAGSPDETGIIPEVANKESQLTPCPPDLPSLETKTDKGVVEEKEELTATATLPERPKELQETSVVEEETPSADTTPSLATHAKRPYETSLFAKEEAKPHKIPKVDDESVEAEKPSETIKPAAPATAKKTDDLDLLKTGPADTPAAAVGAAVVAPATTPDVSAKESVSKDESFADKGGKLPSEETSTAEYLSAPAAKAEGTVEKQISLDQPAEAAAVAAKAPVKEEAHPEYLTTAAATAEALEEEKEEESNVAKVSGVVTGATAPVESIKEEPSVQATAAAAVSEQPQTTITTGIAEAPAPVVSTSEQVSAPNSVVPSRKSSAGAVGTHSAAASSSDTIDSESKLKEEELRKAEKRVEAHRDAIKNLMTDETNPEISRAQKEEAKEEEKEEREKVKKEIKKEEKKQEVKKEEAKKDTPTKPTQEPAPTTTFKKPTEENKPAAPADDKAKEAAREEHKKGGFWSWLKRKVKG